jgi:hypothetical protein
MSTQINTRAAALAEQFENANNALIATIEGCTDEQVRQVCEGEGWSVAVAAHHIAATHTALGQLVQMLANGQGLPPITMEMIHAGNAKHAEEFASVSRDEVLSALRTNGATAAAIVRGLSDEQLDRSAPMELAGGALWSAADIIERIMIEHPLDHGKSIKAALA